ncbi:MAG: class I SAM-dependent methyltransferase [Actinomycetota bacterium]|nr:class I SAM-dependent methyltransferase [Actinomycetota bacterium]
MPTQLTSYYDGPDLTGPVSDALRHAELDPDRLRVEDLAALDQFHALGLPATLALAEIAELKSGERVLDLGAGICGPARALASRFGARVTAVEPLARFRSLAAQLNAATGLEDAIDIVDARGDALPFADGSFDLVWTQAVLPNVADIAAFAAEAHRVLTAGGRWALGETAAGPGGDLLYPVPWADGPADSHLLAPEALRTALERPGFAAEIWEIGLGALTPAGARAASEPQDPRPLPDIGLIMPDRDARMAGLGRNIAERRIAPVLAVLRRAS